MAQTGYTPISIYYSATSTNVPTANNLVAGELAINTADGKLFYKDSAGVVQVIGTKGGVGSSTTTQVLYNSSGLVVGSANMTFNGTALTVSGVNTTSLVTSAGARIGGYLATGVYGYYINAGVSGTDGYIQSLNNTSLNTLTLDGSTFSVRTGSYVTAMTIDSSGYVGLGTTSPSSWATKLVIYNNQATITGGGYDGTFADSIFFAGNAEGTTYRHKISSSISSVSTTSQLKISVSSGSATFVDALTMNGTGAVALNGATKNSSGVGIVFPATQSASSDANCLDDYEEGTWTPAFAGFTGNPTISYSGQSGYYVKVGKVVHCWFNIEISSVSGGSGPLVLTGFPFVAGSFGTWQTGAIGYFDCTTTVPTAIMKESGSTIARFWQRANTSSLSSINTTYDVTSLTSGGKYGYVSYTTA